MLINVSDSSFLKKVNLTRAGAIINMREKKTFTDKTILKLFLKKKLSTLFLILEKLYLLNYVINILEYC